MSVAFFFIYEEVLCFCIPKIFYMKGIQVFVPVQHISVDFQGNTLTCLGSLLKYSLIFKDWSSKNMQHFL